MSPSWLSYENLRVLWWLLIGVLLSGFAIMDGFDLGVGATFRLLGKTDEERGALLLSVEPVWEGNQVWFVLGAGAVFAAWPLLYAAAFSGLYLALFLVLIALILRPVGFAFRDKLTDLRWRAAWDAALTVGGALPALLFGVAFGNLFLGLPFSYDALQRPIVTGALLNLLQPFALLSGAVSLSMLVLHGNAYAALKVGEPMAARARRIGVVAALVYLLVFAAAGLWVGTNLSGYQLLHADPGGPSDPMHQTVVVSAGLWLANFHRWPWMWAAPIAALLAASAAALCLWAQRDGLAFAASVVVQSGTIFTAGFALFPFLLPSSTLPAQSLTVWNASSSEKTLLLMLGGVCLFLPLIIGYTTWVFRVLKGKITLDTFRHGGGY